MRFFNTTGPMKPNIHYCLPLLERFDLDDVLRLIAREQYFVMHAPRQTGKTSCLLALMKYLNERGEYRALYANVEAGQAAREDVGRAMRAILGDIGGRARDYLGDSFVVDRMTPALDQYGPDGALKAILSEWAGHSPLPIVLMLDEVDALVGDTLISLLRQIRSGYDQRPALFPQNIILCGVRDVRDYRIHSSTDNATITGGSAFNIKAKSLRLGDFSLEEVKDLYRQHTEETGQVFSPEALELAWDLSNGQPWVVNALGYEACFEMKEGRDRSVVVSAEMIDAAKENLIRRRETHLDQLADKLAEESVRRVIEPLLAGESLDGVGQDAVQYVEDLGLIRRTPSGAVISNAIYREVIPRELTYVTQLNLESTFQPAWYILPDGRLDMAGLLTSFQEFFRENSEHWLQRFDYQEAGPQLLIQAFLQRVVNGGGQIHREYGLGRGRTDLLIVWPIKPLVDGSPRGPGSPLQQRVVIEIKTMGGPRWKGSRETVIRQGLAQTTEYLDRCRAAESHLVIFDMTPGRTWEEKLFHEPREQSGRLLTLWGC